MRTQSIYLALAIVLHCPIASAQWVQLPFWDTSIRDISIVGTTMLAITNDSGSVYMSGMEWRGWRLSFPKGASSAAISPSSGSIFVVKDDSLYRSTDNGFSWINLRILEQVNVGTNRIHTYCVKVGPNGYIFSGCYARHVGDGNAFGPVLAVSTDNGTTWNWGGVWGGEWFSFRDQCVITSGFCTAVTTGWVGSAVSFNSGLTWNNSSFLLRPPFEWCSNGAILFTSFVPGGPPPEGGGKGELFLSADTGASAKKISDISPSALLALPEGRVLVGTETTGIYLFSDNGDSLKTLNEDLADLHVHAFAIDSSGYVYVGTNKGIWSRPLSQVVSVSSSREFPVEFRLEQNYPNPFNPSTIIKFELPRASNVTLTVYDVLGRQVSMLVNDRRDAGVHEVKFEGLNLAGGVYFYRITVEGYVVTRKMLLLK